MRPKSSKQEVDRFLQLMGLEQEADNSVTIREVCVGESAHTSDHRASSN